MGGGSRLGRVEREGDWTFIIVCISLDCYHTIH